MSIVVVIGPSGAGKSTIGERLAARRGATFVDADDFHAVDNVLKMKSGVPLDEHDRAGWLASLATAIDGWLSSGREVVLACSALRALHRRVLLRDPERMRFVYLRASPEALEERLRARRGHFAGPELLASQLAALEEPDDAITVDADLAPDEVVARIERELER